MRVTLAFFDFGVSANPLPNGMVPTAAKRQVAYRRCVPWGRILRLADVESNSCLSAAEPFVETDPAEARFAQRHERQFFDTSAPVPRLRVTQDLPRIADRLQIAGDDFIERYPFRA